MARRLRLQFPWARYHIINRGNFRQAVFSSAGAGQAFVIALDEAAEQFRWRLHAYVVMAHHYHLALETPEMNLAIGMHWLQTADASRGRSNSMSRTEFVACQIAAFGPIPSDRPLHFIAARAAFRLTGTTLRSRCADSPQFSPPA